jgi:hypothetical protein
VTTLGLQEVRPVRRLDDRGTLDILELARDIPFEVKRIYWMTSREDSRRGGDRHYGAETVVLALVGACTLLAGVGVDVVTHRLDATAGTGIHLPPGVARTLLDFSPDAVVLVLSSATFAEEAALNPRS